MTLNHDAWLDRARARVAAAQLAPEVEEIGRVVAVGDGVAMLSGLPSARLNELLRFATGQLGFVHTLDAETIGAVLLDPAEGVEAGTVVRGTGDGLARPCQRWLGSLWSNPIPQAGPGEDCGPSAGPVEWLAGRSGRSPGAGSPWRAYWPAG